MGFYFISFFLLQVRLDLGLGLHQHHRHKRFGMVLVVLVIFSCAIYPSKHAELSASLLSFTTAVALVIINSGRQLCEHGYSLQLEASVLS